MSWIETCRKFIGIDSTPQHGNREVAHFAAQLCREAGLEVEIEEEEVNGIAQCNVVARPKQTPHESELMLQAHLDTSDPGNFALWTKTQANPFNASIYGGSLYGLGVADVKLDFLCKLEALRRFLVTGRKVKRGVVLVGTFGAQTGMAGAIRLVRRKRISAKHALIGEPTDLQVASAGQGLAVVEISIPFSAEEIEYREQHDLIESGSTQSRIFSGKAAHSSAPELGENAIIKMLDYLSQLPEGIAVMDLDGGTSYNSVPGSAVLEIDLVGGFRDPIVPKLVAVLGALREIEVEMKHFVAAGYTPTHPTINIGMIRTYPDQVRLIGSCRLPPPVTDRDYEAWMDRVRNSCAAVKSTFRIRDYKSAFQTSPDSTFIRDCQAVVQTLGRSSQLQSAASSTEASVFTRLGIECVVFGPGRGAGNSHAPNENIEIEDLDRAIGFYLAVIERYCL